MGELKPPRPSNPIPPPSGHDELEVMPPSSQYEFEAFVSLRWKTPPADDIRKTLGERIAQEVQKVIRKQIPDSESASKGLLILHGWTQVIP